jgi:hypothetical protein
MEMPRHLRNETIIVYFRLYDVSVCISCLFDVRRSEKTRDRQEQKVVREALSRANPVIVLALLRVQNTVVQNLLPKPKAN